MPKILGEENKEDKKPALQSEARRKIKCPELPGIVWSKFEENLIHTKGQL